MREKPMSPDPIDWDRRHFATSGFELDYQEALNALERVLARPDLVDGLRDPVSRAATALRAALD